MVHLCYFCLVFVVLSCASVYKCLVVTCWERTDLLALVWSLSSTGSILSNTDLSDLSTVGTYDIFVYQMRHRVM